MANSRSAKKRIRQNVSRRARNKAYKSMVRTNVKTFESSIKEGVVGTPGEKLVKLQKVLDTAARKGMMHKNTAARKLSRMAKRLASAAV